MTCQYMLNMVQIEEASYEGNDKVLKEWWHQLALQVFLDYTIIAAWGSKC